MQRVKWRAVWLVCWTLFLVADSVFDLREQLTALIAGAERDEPGVFYFRLQTGLLVLFVIVALAPLLWPLAKRWLISPKAPVRTAALPHDPRDTTLAEALGYLVHRAAWGAGLEGAEADRLAAAAAAIEDAARKGRIELRGARPDAAERERIRSDYWLSARIDLAATLDPSGAGGRSAPRGPEQGSAGPVFDGLVADRRALTGLWPADNVWRRTGRATARGVARGVGLGRDKDKSEGG